MPHQAWPSPPIPARKIQTATRKIQMVCRSRRMTRRLPILMRVRIPKASRPASRQFLVALTGLRRVTPIVTRRARSNFNARYRRGRRLAELLVAGPRSSRRDYEMSSKSSAIESGFQNSVLDDAAPLSDPQHRSADGDNSGIESVPFMSFRRSHQVQRRLDSLNEAAEPERYAD